METNKNKKGFTLLELLLVLVIVTAIILIAARYYNQATDASKMSDLTSKIRKITDASYEWVKVAKTFTSKDQNNRTLSIATLKEVNLLSENDTNNPWGSSLTVSGISSTKIQITVPLVPIKICKVIEDNLVSQNMLVTCTTITGEESINDPKWATATIKYPADAT